MEVLLSYFWKRNCINPEVSPKSQDPNLKAQDSESNIHRIFFFLEFFFLEFGAWNLGLGIWDLGLGIWNLEFGTWDLEFGTYNFNKPVYSILCVANV